MNDQPHYFYFANGKELKEHYIYSGEIPLPESTTRITEIEPTTSTILLYEHVHILWTDKLAKKTILAFG